MSVLSCLRGLSGALRTAQGSSSVSSALAISKRYSAHGPRLMPMTATRWQWHKFKDLLHFYVMLGVIPLAAVITYCNIFIGPATLTPIPEGYTPKYWEYSRHPITRFISRYFHTNPQQDYEKYMHFLYEEYEKSQIVMLEREIKKKMAERQDYQAYFYKPAITKYYRASKEVAGEFDRRN